MKYFFIYFLIISVVSVVITCYDKIAAKKFTRHRIRENTLLLLSVLGGSAAMYCTMLIIRHKTKHNKFMIGIPIIIIIQLVSVFVFFGGKINV